MVTMRQNNSLVDVLTMYTDRLNEGRDMAAEVVRTFPEYAPDLAALLDLTRRLKAALMPVKPALAFRQALRANLLVARHAKLVPHITIRNPFRRQRIVLISAAIGSVVSVVVGVIAAQVIRNRTADRTHGLPSA